MSWPFLFAVGVDLVPVHDEFTVCIFPADLEALAFEARDATAAECPAITGDEADPVAAVLLAIHEGGGVAAACGDGSAFAHQIEIRHLELVVAITDILQLLRTPPDAAGSSDRCGIPEVEELLAEEPVAAALGQLEDSCCP
jgi:hypothetical protein